MSKTLLRQQLQSMVSQLDAQIREIQTKTREMSESAGMRIAPEAVQDMNGNYILAPLLAAKAHALSALACLAV